MDRVVKIARSTCLKSRVVLTHCQRSSRYKGYCQGSRFFSTEVRTDAGGDGPIDYVRKHTKLKGEPIPADAAAAAPGLKSLAARLRLEDIPAKTLARCLISDTSTLVYANNAGMAKFGKTILSYYVYEHFSVKYPRLPQTILNHIVDLYTSLKALSEIASNWGVQTDTRNELTRYLANVADEQVLGRLAYTDIKTYVEPGVIALEKRGGNAIDHNGALGTFVRALVSAIYAHRGLDGARNFIHQNIIAPRQLDLTSIMMFSRPTRELMVLCAREGLEKPVARLMAESGRYSSAPMFQIGIFSGAHQIGLGVGSSLREARTRASVNALQSWYLYSPVSPRMPSEESYSAGHIDPGTVVI